MKWFALAFSRYADFSGRSRRKEYWYFMLFNMLFGFVFMALDLLLGTMVVDMAFGPIYIVFLLATFLPSIGVVIRRLHDIGKSGSHLWFLLLPIAGAIYILVLMFRAGDLGGNDYGESPKPEGFTTDLNEEEDTILIAVIGWLVFTKFFFLFARLIDRSIFSQDWFSWVNSLTSFVWGFIPIILALIIKDKSKQKVVFAIGLIYLMSSFYEIIERYLY